MKDDVSFPKQVMLALLVLFVLGAYPLVKFGNEQLFMAVIAGAIITTLNVLLGYAAIEYSHGKSMMVFFKYVIGGMGLRMVAMIIVLVVLITLFKFDAGLLVMSIGAFYMVFLVLEVIYIQKKVSQRQQNS